MSEYEKLSKKVDSLIEAAANCKTGESRESLVRYARVILAVRDTMTVEEAEA